MMKSYILSILFLITTYGFSQKNVVKLDSINLKYEGETKKGLAHGFGKATGKNDRYEGNFKKGYPHGQGIYLWGNGNKYTGNFLKGQMNGKGELIIKRASKKSDSTLTGYFEKNKYIGKFKTPFKITSSNGIRNIDFQKNNTVNNQLKFMIYSNGQLIRPSLSIQDIKNTVIKDIGGYQTMVNINFPLEDVSISFTEENLNYQFSFNLYEQGSWTVIISL